MAALDFRCRLGLDIGAVADAGVGKFVFNVECVEVVVAVLVVPVGYEDTLECLLFLEV